MKILLFIFTLTLYISPVLSQNIEVKDSLNLNWSLSGKFTFLGNQSSYSYWTAGGQTSLSGTIKIDYETMETSVPGVFAAGDIVRGASLVVWAIKDGRDVSDQIIKYVNSKRKKKVA